MSALHLRESGESETGNGGADETVENGNGRGHQEVQVD